jgi:competence protein ComEA
MKLNFEPVRNWFGYSRRERRASFILLVIIVITIAIRYFIPEKLTDIEDITVSFKCIDDKFRLNDNVISDVPVPIAFDPNIADYATLIKAGLDGKAANTLINYRNRGGKFRKAGDIGKVYGISEEQANKLIPFVQIKPDTDKRKSIADATGRLKRALIDLNNCDSALLCTLPGIGPVLSVRIIKYRKLLGGYASVGQLTEVYGLPPETYDIIKGMVYADTSVIEKTRINSATYRELSRLRYLDKYEITSILKYRELEGRIRNMNDLTGNKLVSAEKAEKIRPYVSFEDDF